MSAEIIDECTQNSKNKLNNGSSDGLIKTVPRPLTKCEKEKTPKTKRLLTILTIIVVCVVILSSLIIVVVYFTTNSQDDYGGSVERQIDEYNGGQNTTEMLPVTKTDAVTETYTEGTNAGNTPFNASISISTGATYASGGSSFVTCHVTNGDTWEIIAIERIENGTRIEKAAVQSKDNRLSYIKDAEVPFTLESKINNGNIILIMKFEQVTCEDAGNYTCSMNTTTNHSLVSASSELDIRAKPQKPILTFPAEIIEDKTTALKCEAITDSPDAELQWKIKTPTDSEFIILPKEITREYRTANSDCLHKVESFLSHTPKLSQNGTIFQCEVLNRDLTKRYVVEDSLAVVRKKSLAFDFARLWDILATLAVIRVTIHSDNRAMNYQSSPHVLRTV